MNWLGVVSKYSSGMWTSTNISSQKIYALAIDSHDNVYAGGYTSGGVNDGVYKYSNGTWSATGLTGFNEVDTI